MKRKPKLKKYPDGGFIPLDPLNLVGYRRQILKNPDGSLSTESTIGITGEDGKYYSINGNQLYNVNLTNFGEIPTNNQVNNETFDPKTVFKQYYDPNNKLDNNNNFDINPT